jgi:hypothetical protein
MGVAATQSTSRRGYLSQDELEQFDNITITDSNEADDQISQAEELIDIYVGPQNSFMDEEIIGLASASGATSITLEASQQNTFDIDYFKLCEIEILGGTGIGQRRKVTGSTKAGVLTVDEAWTVNPNTDSFYRIIQLGKFPREDDVETYTNGANTTYYKSIPEMVRRAVAAQVGYFIEMGENFFRGDKSNFKSESIGDYSYTRGDSAGTSTGGVGSLISPKAKSLLKGIINRIGTIEA